MTATKWLVMGLCVGMGTGCSGGDGASAGAPEPATTSEGLGTGPDLTVTEIRGPASVRVSESFTATVKVCNAGTQSVPSGTSVELYLSVRDTLTWPPAGPAGSDQRPIGMASLQLPLEAGQCSSVAVQGYAALPASATGSGRYFLGAVADATQMVAESNESNNTFAKSAIGVGDLADLVITELSGPPSVSPNTAFNVSVKVCNQGTMPAGQSTTQFFLSTDTVLSPTGPGAPPMDQSPLGSVQTPWLVAGECARRVVSLYPNLPPAGLGATAYYLGAIVDDPGSVPELREDNNAFAVDRIGVGSLPDLVITALTSPASVQSGQSLTATVRVCNQGTTPSNGSSVQLYLSTDAVLTPMGSAPPPSDQSPLGSTWLPTLSPGSCTTRSVSGNAWLPPAATGDGAYYLGAIVDDPASVQELREDNNTFVKAFIGVGNRPDLVITSVTGPASVSSGQSFIATVTACNQGTQASPSTNAQVYLARTSSLQPMGPGVPLSTQAPAGLIPFPSLNVGQCLTRSASVYAVSLPPQQSQGDDGLFLGAIIDDPASVPELREDNNVYAQSRIGVGNRPDLVITDMTAPASVQPGQSLTATVTVCNQGTQPSPSTNTQVYLSTSPSLVTMYPPSVEQAPLGMVQTPGLNPGACATRTLTANAYPPPAATPGVPLFIGAIVDDAASVQELREDNNTFAKGLIGVGMLPDLVVTAMTTPTSVQQGQSFSASVTVCNQGTSSAGPANVQLLLSVDDVLTPMSMGGYPASDQSPLGMVSMPSLSPGACSTRSATVSAWLPPDAQGEGGYYVGAIVDDPASIMELREDNNAFVKGLVGVGNRPDLVVTALSVPESLRPGLTFAASATVCNQGTANSPVTQLQVLISVDSSLTSMVGPSGPPSDQSPAGDVSVPSLSPGQCVVRSLTGTAMLPPDAQGEGTYYVGAMVDAFLGVPELREDNNTFVKGLVGVGNRPDLVVTSLTSPASVLSGQGFTTNVTVCNIGTMPTSQSVNVLVLLSTDATLTPMMGTTGGPAPTDQAVVAGFSVPALAAGSCLTQPVAGWASLPPDAQGDGAYYLGAIVDDSASLQELREDNNTFVMGRIGVGNRPDLVVSSLSGPTSVALGTTLSASVKVCNQGTMASPASIVALLLSVDTVLSPEPSPAGPAYDQRLVGTLNIMGLSPGACITSSVSGPAYLPADATGPGAFYLGAFVDPGQSVLELREDNNTWATSLIQVTQ
ncbi:hypothetical protein LZ198_23830 [Myxococcus sp. K15C18031901]|uniref:CARDB domain-containing protein n=1 Tax=Myxococcus dinghuensis TaxID=2906761 RepID=UPI0020A7E3CB|nr:CARDB domain-containing protein [Myxococcus dinghuensis]MCP3101900.1 hypothetical protein [Myxococcus dinghuensis]